MTSSGRALYGNATEKLRPLFLDEGLEHFTCVLSRHDIEVLAEAASGSEVLKKVDEHEFDAVVLDISMPGSDGLEVLSRLCRQRPQLPVLILSVHDQKSFAVRVFKTDAKGYLAKNVAIEELVAAIRKLAKGGTYVQESLVDILTTPLEVGEAPEDKLTNREFEVFCRLASGITVSEIAGELDLSVKTVSTNRTRILKEMHMRNNAQLIRYAFQRRLVS